MQCCMLLGKDGIYKIVESLDSNYITTCFLNYDLPSTGRISYMIDDYHTACIDNHSVSELSMMFSKLSLCINQEYVRIHYDDNILEFEISSVMFDWSNIIFDFVSKFSQNNPVESITIGRIIRKDNMTYHGIYRNQNNIPIYKQSITQYFKTDTSHMLKLDLNQLRDDIDVLDVINSDLDFYNKLLDLECLQCTIYTNLFKTCCTRTMSKLSSIQRKISENYSDIYDVYIDSLPHTNSKDNNVGISYIYLVRSYKGESNIIRVDYTKSCISEDIMYRDFCLHYNQSIQN